jgi:hypothetical protein
MPRTHPFEGTVFCLRASCEIEPSRVCDASTPCGFNTPCLVSEDAINYALTALTALDSARFDTSTVTGLFDIVSWDGPN